MQAADSTNTLRIGERIFALQNLFALDGRSAIYPPSIVGYASSNCYLVNGVAESVLVDTGFTVHRDQLSAQIDLTIDRTNRLMIYPLRVQEFNSSCNAMFLAEKYRNCGFYGTVPRIDNWVNFQPGIPLSVPGLAGHRPEGGRFKTTVLAGAASIDLGDGRSLKVLAAPMRTVTTRWLYEQSTRTLFTSDLFSHMWQSDPDEGWTVDEVSPESLEGRIRAFLLGARYWWLPGANTDALRGGLAAVFGKYDVETIAPAFGRVLRGRAVVRQHYDALQNVLGELGKVKSHYVSREEIRAVQ